ncbi:MAG: [Fe-Fe] hydrogenase large subunit C-terminal domain-containing protein [Bacteroidota bacterium]|nr:[Fe-Fe] hydrogenase large subunit C-terminal domain-containing protein [Bacteroidota bacterium]
MQTNQESQKIIFTNKAKCRDCNRCVRYCPVKAIKIKNGQAQVSPELCITCGTCVLECPQKAKAYRNDVEKVRLIMSNGKPNAISIAPSFSSIYDEWERKRLPSALRMLGFNYIAETAVGAYYTAIESKKYIEKNPDRTHILTSCPVLVNYIEKYHIELIDILVPVVSPMIAHAKIIKKKFDDNVNVIFVGPCIAKKYESERPEYEGLIDAVITFEELEEMFAINKVSILNCEESIYDDLPYGKSQIFPLVGGILQTAEMGTDMLNLSTISINGIDEISNVVEHLNENQGNYIIEPLFCRNGCINGPAILNKSNYIEKRKQIIEYVNRNSTGKNIENISDIFLKTKFSKKNPETVKTFSEEEIKEVLKRTGKNTVENELNCGACGYNSCREKAIAVLNGIAEPEVCLPYMKRIAEAKSDMLIESSPNGVVVLDDKLHIMNMNPAFKKMFMCSDAVLNKNISYIIDSDPFEKIASGVEKEISKLVRYPSYNLICNQICYTLVQKNQYIGIFVDVTDIYQSKEELNNIKKKTIIQAQDLMEHQVKMAQELVQFLGENTAKGEILLKNLIDAIKK